MNNIFSFIKRLGTYLMKGFDMIRRSNWNHWIDAISWLIASSIGGLLPLWGTWILLTLFSQQVTPSTFTANGEFALYSASMVSAAFYVVTKEDSRGLINEVLGWIRGQSSKQNIRGAFPGQRIFILISSLLLTVSTLLFAGATFAHLPGVNLPLNLGLLQSASVIIFLVVMIMSYLITVIDSVVYDISDAELRTINRESMQSLENEVDALRKGN